MLTYFRPYLSDTRVRPPCHYTSLCCDSPHPTQPRPPHLVCLLQVRALAPSRASAGAPRVLCRAEDTNIYIAEDGLSA